MLLPVGFVETTPKYVFIRGEKLDKTECIFIGRLDPVTVKKNDTRR